MVVYVFILKMCFEHIEEINQSRLVHLIEIIFFVIKFKVSHAIKYEYKKIPSANCLNNDIKVMYGKVKACIRKCDAINRCVGFRFYFRGTYLQWCWLKYKCDIIISAPTSDSVYLKPGAVARKTK